MIPTTIGFIDTSVNDTGIRPLIVYFKRKIEFEQYLKKSLDVYLLELSINKLDGAEMEIVMDVYEIDSKTYFGPVQLYSFFDKRKIKLLFNRQKQSWEYASLIKVWAHPHPSND